MWEDNEHIEIGDEAHAAVSHAILSNSALFAEVEVKGADWVLYHSKVLDVGGELEPWAGHAADGDGAALGGGRFGFAAPPERIAGLEGSFRVERVCL